MIARTTIAPAATTKTDRVSTLAAEESVAVVVVNYNAGHFLQECLRAIARQTCPPQRIIVVDNASSDESLDGLAAIYPGVEIVPAGGNIGFAAANNLAIRLAGDCRWVALVNPDAFVESDWLERLLAAARAAPECRFFSCQLVSAGDPRRLDGTGDVYHVSGRAWRRDSDHLRNQSGAIDEKSSTPTFGACAAAALYRRDALVEVGGFDENFFCYYEDVDLSFRLQLAGYSGVYVAEAVARHVGSANTGRHSDFSVYYGHRNLVWTFVKNMPGPLFWLYLPQHVALNLATVAWFALQGRGRVILRAKWDALRGLPRAWRQRRAIQSQRKASVRQIYALMARGPLRAFTGR